MSAAAEETSQSTGANLMSLSWAKCDAAAVADVTQVPPTTHSVKSTSVGFADRVGERVKQRNVPKEVILRRHIPIAARYDSVRTNTRHAMKIWTGVEIMACTAICIPLEKGGALREHTVIKASGSWRNKRR
jgi:hypothetical protein